MFFKKAKSPAKGCLAEVSVVVGIILNILNIVNFFYEKEKELEVEGGPLHIVLRPFDFIQEDRIVWGLIIFYGLSIAMTAFLGRLEEQPVGSVGAFLMSGFFVCFISPIVIYPFFDTYKINFDVSGMFVAAGIIIPAVLAGWFLYNFLNR